MPDSTPPDSSSPLVDEALAWLVRIHSGQASEEERRACTAWRMQSSAHHLAYAEAEKLWRDIGLVPNGDRAGSASPDQRDGLFYRVARRFRNEKSLTALRRLQAGARR